MEHSLKLTSVGNARDLGGYAAGGKTIREGRLLRAASVAGLSEEDRHTLETVYRVAAVVDLRMSTERRLAPDPEISGAASLFLPVMEMEDYSGYDPKLAKMLLEPGANRLELMKNAYEMGMLDEGLYTGFLFSDRGKAAYRGLFDCLLTLPEGRACLWHCTDGKDRTGVAAMLVLTALGADRETVMHDYLLTNEFNAPRLAAVRAGLARAALTPELRELALFGSGAVYEAYMTNALRAMDARCGSSEGYLARELGVGPAECAALRRKFLR